MRTFLAIVLLTPSLTFAQSAAATDAMEAIDAPAPAYTLPPLIEERMFNTVEVFRLDPGTYRVELEGLSGVPQTQPTLELRAQIGLTDHVQLSVAQDVSEVTGNASVLSATPIALRYSLGKGAGEVLGNPAIEAELIPRADAPARAGLRLMAAEEIAPRVVLAVNGYVEQNLNRTTSVGVDGAFGMTAGLSYSLVPGLLRIGGEAKFGEAQYGLPSYSFVAALGPNFALHRGPFAMTSSLLADLALPKVGLEPLVTVGLTF